VRTELTVDSKTVVRGYDGEHAWQIGRDGKVSAISGDDLRDIQEEGDIDGPLIDWRAKGIRLHTTDFRSDDCFEIELTLPNSDLLLECVSRITSAVVSEQLTRRGHVVAKTSFKHYRKIEGLRFADELEIRQTGNPEPLRLKLHKVEINPEIDDSRFSVPQQAQ
jgi:hypothetical protein